MDHQWRLAQTKQQTTIHLFSDHKLEKICKHCNAYTNHTTKRSKDCVKYPEWKRDQERKNKNKQSNQQTNDCHNELTIGTDNQTNNQTVVSKNIPNDHAIVQSSTAATSSEVALLMSPDDNF